MSGDWGTFLDRMIVLYMPCFLVTTLCGYVLSYGVLLLGIVYLPTFMSSCLSLELVLSGSFGNDVMFVDHSFVANTPLLIIFMIILVVSLNSANDTKRRK